MTRGENLARNVRKTRLPRLAQAGGRQSHVRQSGHHRIAADGCLRGRERHPLHPRPPGGCLDVDGRRLCPGLRQSGSAQSPRRARARQCHGHALRRHEGECAGAGHRRPAGQRIPRHRAGIDRRPADLGAAVRQMGRRSASRRGPAALCASRGKDRAGAADRPGVPVAARRHPQERRRHRHARTDAHRAAHAWRCRRGRRRRRDAGQGRAAGHHRRRHRGAEPGAQGSLPRSPRRSARRSMSSSSRAPPRSRRRIRFIAA